MGDVEQVRYLLRLQYSIMSRINNRKKDMEDTIKNPVNIRFNDADYVRADSVSQPATDGSGLPFVLIRTYSAGVHFGYLKRKEYTQAGIVVELINARRIWSWQGANSLSQIANDGLKPSSGTKIAMPITIELVAIEIIPILDKARIALESVPQWKQ